MKALLLAEFGKPHYPELRKAFPGVRLVEAYDDAAVKREVVDSEIVFGYLTSEQFDLAERLRWIQTLDAGMEGLFNRVPQVIESEVVVTNARGAGAPMIGEHAVALMLALSRQLPRFWHDKQERRWDQGGALEVVEFLGNKTCGIVGFGKSGRETGWRAKALGMSVIAVDKHPVDGDPIVDEVWPLDRLPDLLSKSDYVVITVPYSPENENLLGAAELAMMKPTARLVVTSRGRIVEHKALVKALVDGTIAGAGLDTVIREPLPSDNELWDLPNVIITPHIAGNAETELLDERTVRIFEQNLARYVAGKELLNVVDKKLRY